MVSWSPAGTTSCTVKGRCDRYAIGMKIFCAALAVVSDAAVET